MYTTRRPTQRDVDLTRRHRCDWFLTDAASTRVRMAPSQCELSEGRPGLQAGVDGKRCCPDCSRRHLIPLHHDPMDTDCHTQCPMHCDELCKLPHMCSSSKHQADAPRLCYRIRIRIGRRPQVLPRHTAGADSARTCLACEGLLSKAAESGRAVLVDAAADSTAGHSVIRTCKRQCR